MMEDRYLFRGKDVKSNLFVIGFYSACPEGIPEDGITLLHYITDINNNVFVVYPETVGQCTGLKDKNGKPIFEHDICVDSLSNKFTVVWDNENARFIGKSKDCIYYIGKEPTVTIIGNTHENKET